MEMIPAWLTLIIGILSVLMAPLWLYSLVFWLPFFLISLLKKEVLLPQEVMLGDITVNITLKTKEVLSALFLISAIFLPWVLIDNPHLWIITLFWGIGLFWLFGFIKLLRKEEPKR
jgi:hypothetical protein